MMGVDGKEGMVAWLFKQTISDGGRSGNTLASDVRESIAAGPGAPDRVLQAA
jgi:hypothetical protein